MRNNDSRPAKKRGALLKIVCAVVVIVIMTVPARMAFRQFYRSAYPVHFRELVEEHSLRNDLPPSLIFAVIRTESGFDPEAISSVEARGLMQITHDTFQWAQMKEREPQQLEFDTLFDTAVNIRYGAVILRLLLDEFGSVENALCAYHAGWGSVTRWLENPEYSRDGRHLDRIPFADTAYYVDRVLEAQQTYQRLYDFT